MLPEKLTRTDIHSLQEKKLHLLLDAVVPANPFWSQKIHAVDIKSIQTLSDLQHLPFCTKSELVADHTANFPYGSNLTFPLENYSRMHQTSGTTGEPMRWMDTPESWNWVMSCWEQIYRMVGLKKEDRLCFPFSFGPFIGFWAAFEGAARLKNLCLAGGGMSSLARLRLIQENQITMICCTPTYALRLAEVAKEEGIDIADGSVRAILVAGEPGGSIPATRERIEQAWGARLFDHWGMTDIGSLGIESEGRPGGLYILETECIAEIIHPETLQPVAKGAQGELVITNLGRHASPVIRYRTGDLVVASTEKSPDGYELLFLEGGILGRVDDMMTIRGNNLFPSSLEAIIRQYEDIAEYRIEVDTSQTLHHLKIEIEPVVTLSQNDLSSLLKKIAQHIKDRLNFQAEVVAVETGALPRFDLKGKRFFRKEG
ncbi:Coenzyme A ligase [hydrothermal vent metagenome]|uniref:Coenzyme A ligase n=1 Tax=hydrothermal vent metagenome TaxID=652676 RepID=A0A3B1DEP7_9ZZZZ